MIIIFIIIIIIIIIIIFIIIITIIIIIVAKQILILPEHTNMLIVLYSILRWAYTDHKEIDKPTHLRGGGGGGDVLIEHCAMDLYFLL